jgi:stress-induced morphogen
MPYSRAFLALLRVARRSQHTGRPVGPLSMTLPQSLMSARSYARHSGSIRCAALRPRPYLGSGSAAPVGYGINGDIIPARRGFASGEADIKVEAVEPPDYLDEKEREIFDKLKLALDPTALEVRISLSILSQPRASIGKLLFNRRVSHWVVLDTDNQQVQDISGGCGSMYGIAVSSEKFKGIPMIKQHRLVNEILGDQIKTWHGIQLKTKAP